jgi:2'-5' RNA ligase
VTLRLFVAADLDDGARDVVADAVERLLAAGVVARFDAREKWHATVAFLGSVDEARYDVVLDAFRAGALACEPFEATLDIVGAFPSTVRPRVVWVGSSEPSAAFAACVRVVRSRFIALGFAFRDEGDFHVTVCRLKRPDGPLPAVTLTRSARICVDALTLYQSLPDGPTTRYAVRERIPLGKIL